MSLSRSALLLTSVAAEAFDSRSDTPNGAVGQTRFCTLRHVGGERLSTCRPRCRRDAPASNRSGGRGRCRDPLICFRVAYAVAVIPGPREAREARESRATARHPLSGFRVAASRARNDAESVLRHLSDLFDLAARRRADDRFAHRRAVDDLLGRDRERRARPRPRGRRLRRQARVTSSFSASQTSSGALDRLELAGAEQPRAPLLRRGAGDVRHAFEPQPALGAEHLEAEARRRSWSWCRDSRTCRPSCGTASRWCRRCSLCSDAREALAIDVIDLAAQIDHGVDRVHAHRRKPAAAAPPPSSARHAVGLQEQRVGKGHVASTCWMTPRSPERMRSRSLIISGWKRRL